MNYFPVSPPKEHELNERMAGLGVKEKDFSETFIRSQGPGGQNVNKVSTCVVLVHKPTGLSVRCQQSRSQSLNRFYARRILLDKIEKLKKGFVAKERARIEKIRRQKRKRSKRAKEKMLYHKKMQSQKKDDRKNISAHQDDL